MQTSMFAFFSETGGVLPPRPYGTTAGRTMPTRDFRLTSSITYYAHGSESVTFPRNSVLLHYLAKTAVPPVFLRSQAERRQPM
jgi:hypothetical protein